MSCLRSSGNGLRSSESLLELTGLLGLDDAHDEDGDGGEALFEIDGLIGAGSCQRWGNLAE